MRKIVEKTKDEMESTCFHCSHFYMDNDKEPTCNIDKCEFAKTCFGYCSKESIEKYNKSLIPEELKRDIESYKKSYQMMKEGKRDHYFDCIAENLVNKIHDFEKNDKITHELAKLLLDEYSVGGQYMIMNDISKESYKVIFLDVDGVINNDKTKELSPNGFIGIDDNLVLLVKEIVDKTGARIVLSSSWRADYIDKKVDGIYLDNKLKKQNLTIIDTTEIGGIKQDRGEQIRKYVDSHNDKISQFVILDDEFKEFFIRYKLQDNLVSTNYADGLTRKDVEKAIEILNK